MTKAHRIPTQQHGAALRGALPSRKRDAWSQKAAKASEYATETIPADLRALAARLTAESDRLRSITAAFRLAANAEHETDVHELFWPDLIEVIESKLPDPQALDREVTSLIQKIERALAHRP